MIYSKEVQEMCQVAKGPNHGPAPIQIGRASCRERVYLLV